MAKVIFEFNKTENIEFQEKILTNEKYLEGLFDTGFIDREIIK